jgi:Domain of unknown function (DUF4390)
MRYSRSAERHRQGAASALRRGVLLGAFALLGGCGLLAEQQPGSLGVRQAQRVVVGASARLELALDCRLSGPMQDALDHGIPIAFEVDVRAGHWPRTFASAQPRIELRYFPLSRRYQLRVVGSDDVRAFATQAHLVAALGSLRLGLPSTFAALPPDTRLRVSVAIDPAALPGALRLPALFEPAWRLASAETTWPAAAR